MNNIINTIGIILNIVGTILTLWTTFTTQIKDVGTWGEAEKRQKEFPKEKRRVKLGCCLIAVGGMAQIVSQFV